MDRLDILLAYFETLLFELDNEKLNKAQLKRALKQELAQDIVEILQIIRGVN